MGMGDNQYGRLLHGHGGKMNKEQTWNQWISNVMLEDLVHCDDEDTVSRRFTVPKSLPKEEKVLTYHQSLEGLTEPPRASGHSSTWVDGVLHIDCGYVGCEESETLLDEIEEITETIEIPREARMIELPMHFWGVLKGMQGYRQFKGYSVHDIALHFLGKAIFGDRYDGN